jgi:hypothetical protein
MPPKKTPKTNELLVEVFDDLKELLATKKKVSEHLITSRDTLTGDLGFSKSGLRDFADKINAFPKFAQYHVAITATKVASCSTVGDLAIAIYKAIP